MDPQIARLVRLHPQSTGDAEFTALRLVGTHSATCVSLARCVVFVLVHAAEDMRRVSIGVALVQQPGALVVDDPTGGLSHAAGNRIMRILKVWLQAGGRPTVCRPPSLMLPLKCPPFTVPAAAS